MAYAPSNVIIVVREDFSCLVDDPYLFDIVSRIWLIGSEASTSWSS